LTQADYAVTDNKITPWIAEKDNQLFLAIRVCLTPPRRGSYAGYKEKFFIFLARKTSRLSFIGYSGGWVNIE
jgi:hypothetical protein